VTITGAGAARLDLGKRDGVDSAQEKGSLLGAEEKGNVLGAGAGLGGSLFKAAGEANNFSSLFA
jgi:hypothetical protein